jgi:hypothetical protein
MANTKNKTSELFKTRVTSIRLDDGLLARLKQLSGSYNDQDFIRKVLTAYISDFSLKEVLYWAVAPAGSHPEERCVLTGVGISEDEPVLYGFTRLGMQIPIAISDKDELEDELEKQRDELEKQKDELEKQKDRDFLGYLKDLANSKKTTSISIRLPKSWWIV